MNKNIIAAQSIWNLGNMQVFSYGNKKLPKETLIVNITSAQNCPSDKLGFCKHSKICYAKKCERIYKNYLEKNLLIESYMYLWNSSDIINLLCAYIDNAPVKIKNIRLNEAGDFPNQSNVIEWSNIAEYINNKYGISTYCYTCREDLDFSNVKFIVNASTQNIKADRYFLCVNKEDFKKLPKNSITCKGNCNLCKLCYDSNYHGIIYCKQH